MTNQSENSTEPRSLKQLLAELQSEQAAWLAWLDEIGEENMTQPEVAGGWSIKDIVAHITGWRRRTVNRFRAALDPSTDMIALWPAEWHEDANYKFSEKYPDGKQFFQASKRQVPSFSVNSHPSVQNWSTLRLIYQEQVQTNTSPNCTFSGEQVVNSVNVRRFLSRNLGNQR